MSLARTALRLAVIEALKADPTVAALCGARIFDSLIEEFDSSKPVPMIVVLTEEDGGKAYSVNNGGPPFDQVCDLVLEIAVREVVQEDGEEPQIAIPQTDRELEAAIDLLEHAAVAAITVADTPASLLVRKAVTRRATRYSSTRFTSDKTGMKFAVREVRLTLELKGETRFNPLDIPTGPFATLPEPLRTVCQAMPAGSSGAQTCQLIAAALAGETPQPFAGVVSYLAVKRQAYPAAAPAPLGSAAASETIVTSFNVKPEAPHA